MEDPYLGPVLMNHVQYNAVVSFYLCCKGSGDLGDSSASKRRCTYHLITLSISTIFFAWYPENNMWEWVGVLWDRKNMSNLCSNTKSILPLLRLYQVGYSSQVRIRICEIYVCGNHENKQSYRSPPGQSLQREYANRQCNWMREKKKTASSTRHKIVCSPPPQLRLVPVKRFGCLVVLVPK